MLRINRHHHRLRAEALRDARDQSRVGERGGVDADLVRPGGKHGGGIVQSTNASAHREGNEQLARGSTHGIEKRGAILVRRRDIQKHDFVCAGLAVRLCQRGRIACIAQVHKLHALYDASAVDVEASDDAFGQHVRVHKSCEADAIQLLRIFPDETGPRRDDLVPPPPRICRRTRSLPPYSWSKGLEKSARSTQTTLTIDRETGASRQKVRTGSIPREEISRPRGSARTRHQRVRGQKSGALPGYARTSTASRRRYPRK